MALLEEQFTETLQAGAPDITYQGNEGQEQKIARELWDQLPPEAQMQFGSFQQFFSSGAWKKVLQMLQQQMQQQGPQQMAPQPQQGISSMMPAQMAYGGIAGADGRRQYGIGSWFQKKIMDPIKKNPLITAAVLGAGSTFLPGPTHGWIGKALKGLKGKGITSALGNILSKPEWMIPAASLVAGAFAKPEQQLEGGAISRGAGINLQDIAKLANITDEQQGQAIGLNFLPEASARKYSPEEMALTYAATEGAAQGGRIGYQTGKEVGPSEPEIRFDEVMPPRYLPEWVKPAPMPKRGPPKDWPGDSGIYRDPGDWKKRLRERFLPEEEMTMASAVGDESDDIAMEIFGKPVKELNPSELEELNIHLDNLQKKFMAQGGRIGAQEGGLMSLGGMEMDLRGGGFVPLGAQEKADDVPARLSKNEFVFTADAVRAAGGGDVDAGADKMYNTMKQLESRVG